MHNVSIPAANRTPGAPIPAKLLRAAKQFEAILLNDLLGPVEKSFSSVPGTAEAIGSGEYQYLGTQALASTMAATGGFGIAAMIVRNIMKHNELSAHGPLPTAGKVLPSVGR